MLSSSVAVGLRPAAPPRDGDDLDRWGKRPLPDPVGPAVWEMGEPPVTGPAALLEGRCCAWPLPWDVTCAAEARGVFREALSGLGLPQDLIYDGMTMASELAANTLHALGDQVGREQWPVAGGPELWIYLRHEAGRWELVCKVFDSLAGWKARLDPGPGLAADGLAAGGAGPGGAGPGGLAPSPAALDSVSGRGLQVVAGLSGGRWGHHLTRSRLGGWKVPGKAVWFALPVPATVVPDALHRSRLGPCQVARKLEMMLTDRGLGGSLLRADEPGAGMSVVSVRCGLTVWCRGTMVSWRTRTGGYEQRSRMDLEEAAERIVCICEEIDHGVGAGYGGDGRVR